MGELKLQRFTKTYPLQTCNFRKECVPNLIYDETIVNGLITKEFYYADEDKTELVISVDVSYEYGLNTLVNKIRYDINYYTDPNSGEVSEIGLTVPKVKVLTQRQKLSLLKKRRKTVRESAEAAVLGLLQMSLTNNTIEEILAKGASFLLKYDTALDHYEKVGSPSIISQLETATEDWLDLTPLALGGATIRQYLQGVFSV